MGLPGRIATCLALAPLLALPGPAMRAASWNALQIEESGAWVSAVLELAGARGFRAATTALGAPAVNLAIDFTPDNACSGYGFLLQSQSGVAQPESRAYGPHRGAIRVDDLPTRPALVLVQTQAGDDTCYLAFTLAHPHSEGPGLLTELMQGRTVRVRTMLGQSEIHFRFSLAGAGPALRRAYALCTEFVRLEQQQARERAQPPVMPDAESGRHR
jgi:hypothetical protein